MYAPIEKVIEYLDGFYVPISEELADMRTYAESQYIPIIRKQTEVYLNSLLETFRPKKILEIGTAIGYGAIYFAMKCPEAQIVSIERDDAMFKIARHNIAEINLTDRITVLKGEAVDCLEELRLNDESEFDFIFIDAGKSHYIKFMELAMKLAKNGAYILSDDILLRGTTSGEEYDPRGKHKTAIRRMRSYLEFITHHKNLKTSLLTIGDGLAISIYGKDIDERI